MIKNKVKGGNFIFEVTIHHERSQGRSSNQFLEVGTETEAQNEYCLRDCSQSILSLLCYLAQDHVGVSVPQWTGHSHTNHYQGKGGSQPFPKDSLSNGGIPHLRVFLPRFI